ncbi:MAG: hypothetical protein ACRD9R_07290 [Pyrinomonadaceae bacterium]
MAKAFVRSLIRGVVLWALLVVPAATARAQGVTTSQPLVVSLPQGGFVAFRLKTTSLNPSGDAGASQSAVSLQLSEQGLVGAGNTVHRLLVDGKGNFAFGYDLTVEPLDGGRKFRVTARPLAAEVEAKLRAGSNAARAPLSPLNVATLTGSTSDQIVADGESFALDLLVNERLGVKVVDYVKLSAERPRPSAPAGPPTRARDFSVVNVEMAVRNYQIRVDGEVLRTAGARRGCSGSLVWLYLPGRGRFIFSLVPQERYDFRKIGVIENNTIAFEWEGVRYEWVSAEPVVGSGGTWNLWVLHDPAYGDAYAPPAVTPDEESKVARALRDPVGALTGRSVDRGFGSPPVPEKRPTPAATERLRVRVGGAASVEALLPKN